MYASGIPLGLLTDAKGPRLTTFIGAIALGIGYYPIYSGSSGPCEVDKHSALTLGAMT